MKKNIVDIEKRIAYLKQKKKEVTISRNTKTGAEFFKVFPELENATITEIKDFISKLGVNTHGANREN